MILATSTGLYPIDSMTAELAYLGQLATGVLSEHGNDAGHCAQCTYVPFPCSSAVLAAAIQEAQNWEW